MDNAPAPQADAAAAPADDVQRIPPEEAAERLKAFIRCRPGRPHNYCNGRGTVWAIVKKQRVKALCSCVEEGIKAAEAAREAAAAASKQVFDLAERAAGLEPPAPPPPPDVPRGARERLALIERELGREVERHGHLEVSAGEAISALEKRLVDARLKAAGELRVIELDEAAHDRLMVEAQGAKRLAGEEIERLRARVEELRAILHDADATIERLTNQGGQYSARRMTVTSQLETDASKIEAQIRTAKAEIGPNLRRSGARVDSLRYRLEQHLSRHPGLRTPPS